MLNNISQKINGYFNKIEILKLLKKYSIEIKKIEYDLIDNYNVNCQVEYIEDNREETYLLNVLWYFYNKKRNNIVFYYLNEPNSTYISEYNILLSNIIKVVGRSTNMSINNNISSDWKYYNEKVKIHDFSKINLNNYSFMKNNSLDMQSWYKMIWFDCPVGWRPILKVVLDEFEKEYINWQDIKIQQIKEKFAEFRIYHTWNNKTHNITSWASYKSLRTCMVCWEKWTQTKDSYWIDTLCPIHMKEHKTKSFPKMQDEFKEKNWLN